MTVTTTERAQASPLSFDKTNYTEQTLTLPTGQVVKYKAYERLYYVVNVEDSAYQYMNVFVPEGATNQTPIFMPNKVGGYMAARAGMPNAGDASGRALAEGYVVAIPGARGRNSVVTDKEGNKTYTGRAPKGLLDLKAAVRYLRLFDKDMPGDAEKIISDGTSAGGAMSALLGATGNHPDYAPLLKAMGAADTRDDIFAAVCFCPIIDLDHADMAYEWLYGVTNGVSRPVTEEQEEVSKALAALYPAYLESLQSKTPSGEAITADNYRDYIKSLLIESAQIAKDAGADIPDNIGFSFGQSQRFVAPVNGRDDKEQMPPMGMDKEQMPPMAMDKDKMPPRGNDDEQAPSMETDKKQTPPMKRDNGPMRMNRHENGEYIVDLDMDKYLNYVVTTIPLKTAPAFDSQGVTGGRASGENEEFGNEQGISVNFTDFSLQQATGDANATVDEDVKWNVRLLNPLNYIGDPKATNAQHWYIRHGARDRDTSFNVPVSLALKLQNEGKDVDFRLPWNRPHSGDYALNELFKWIEALVATE